MTVKFVKEVGIVYRQVRRCDAPNWHRGSRIIEGGQPISVQHGYGIANGW